MKKQFVYDPLISKRQQYLLATQVCDFFISPPSFQLKISHSLQLVRAVLKIGIYLLFSSYTEFSFFHPV
jgi:hypothetical protein